MRSCRGVAVAALLVVLTEGAVFAQGEKMPPDKLDQLVAPIALYPDALVIQIAQCSGSPFEVKQVSEWLDKNPSLKGTAAQDAASKQGFDASFVALILFPQVIHMMSEKPDWCRELGAAFTTQRDDLLNAVQRMRKKAQDVGNLKTTEQQKVDTVTTQSGDQVIVIQPANPQVVYVPQYNPQVVYTQPPPAQPEQSSNGKAVAAGLVGFGAGILLGHALADNDDDHFYCSYGGWGYHGAICCPGGYNDYYNHRENMANDYYNHRENMANQASRNQANRQNTATQNQSNRQDSRASQQSSRQDQHTQNQGTRNDEHTQNQATRSDAHTQNQATRSDNQANRQASAGQRQSMGESPWHSSSSHGSSSYSSGAYRSSAFSGSHSSSSHEGAFSGYQRGSSTSSFSERGHSSFSSSSFGSRSGGYSGGSSFSSRFSGGSHSYGGRSGGGGGRRR